MKILVISNLYPPYCIGGYEIGCRDVTNALVDRGHEVKILTSDYQCTNANRQNNIYRELLHSFPENSKLSRNENYKKLMIPFRQLANQVKFKKYIEEFNPDIVFFWNLSNIGPWLFDQVGKYRIPSVCYVSDHWLAEGYHDSSYPFRLGKICSFKNGVYSAYLLLASRIFRLQDKCCPPYIPRMLFTSRYIEKTIRESLTPGIGSEVLYWGIHCTQREIERASRNADNNVVSLVYSGQIAEHKGIRTAILAVAELLKRNRHRIIKFHLAGAGNLEFFNEMKELVSNLGLSEFIIFEGKLERPALTQLLNDSDIYLFPSEWNEPFSISLLEGMASGCAVVSTSTGGSSEILVDGYNCLIFKAGHVINLVDRLENLLKDESLRKELGANAAKLVHDNFQITKMVDRIEMHLVELISSSI